MLEARIDPNLVFLKLGGSLITDKDRAETADLDSLTNLLSEVCKIHRERPNLKLLLGHGSGSFGHHAASQAGTREGVFTAVDWQGYQSVWASAHRLHQIVLAACLQAGLPVISFPPSACVVTNNHKIHTWELAPIASALSNGLIPLVYGDVVCDLTIGGTILSTEDLFFHLALALRPAKILLAGEETAVFADYPRNQEPLSFIRKDAEKTAYLQGSASKDVTGGMLSKVQLMQNLCKQLPGMQAVIFSGRVPENLSKILGGELVGTRIG